MTDKTQAALKLALGYMDGTLVTDHLTGYERKRHVMEAIREALAEQPAQPQQESTNCRHCGGDDNVICAGQCKEQPAQQQEPDWLDKEQTKTDWDHVWLLIKAASYASSRGFISGTSNWGSAVSRYMRNESPQPAQQQEPDKDGSPCPEFWDWLPKTYNFVGDGIFTKYNMEVAFLAGKQSVSTQEPVAWINWCAATGKRSVSFECESELASQPLYEGITQNTQYHYSKFHSWFDSELHRQKYTKDHPAYLAAQEAWNAANDAAQHRINRLNAEIEAWKVRFKIAEDALAKLNGQEQKPVAWTSWRELAGARHYGTSGWVMHAHKRSDEDIPLYTKDQL